MTAFGDQPERDRIKTTQAEREAFALLAGNYGAYELPETEVRVNIEFAAEVPAPVEKFLDGTPVPTGYGQANLEEVKAALAAGRPQIIDSHNAWLELGEEMADAAHKAESMARKAVYTAAILAGTAGTALGFGLAELLRLVVR